MALPTFGNRSCSSPWSPPVQCRRCRPIPPLHGRPATFEFYIEVMSNGEFQGDLVYEILLTGEEIIAREKSVDPRTMGVADLKGGAQRLDVRFVCLDYVVDKAAAISRRSATLGQRQQLGRASRLDESRPSPLSSRSAPSAHSQKHAPRSKTAPACTHCS